MLISTGTHKSNDFAFNILYTYENKINFELYYLLEEIPSSSTSRWPVDIKFTAFTLICLLTCVRVLFQCLSCIIYIDSAKFQSLASVFNRCICVYIACILYMYQSTDCLMCKKKYIFIRQTRIEFDLVALLYRHHKFRGALKLFLFASFEQANYNYCHIAFNLIE